MKHNFSAIPRANIQRSGFNRSHAYKTAFDSGYLIPFFVDEALPGDVFKMRFNHLTRLTTPIVPVMDNMFLETFFFAVPKRLVWDHWQNFCGERENPEDSTDYLIPQVESGDPGFSIGSIFDYMGVPPLRKCSVNALIPRCYNLIYNEWFCDQNLQVRVPVPKGDGPDWPGNYKLLRRGKRHDYFTSCLPWPQKGPGVEISLGDSAAVVGNGRSLGLTDGVVNRSLRNVSSVGLTYSVSDPGGILLPSEFHSSDSEVLQDNFLIGVSSDPEQSGLMADLSSADPISINSLRQAFQLQRMLETDARGGTRYTEILRAHFNVISPDARLQRPEYLGGSHTAIHTYPVAQTGATDGVTPQGNLAAYGVGRADDELVIDKSFTEHCYVIGLVNVRADLTYQQGLNRMWSRKTRYDFYWPTLAHLGEQAVLNKEIYLQGTDEDDEVFGYQERYAEYRYKPSLITGKLRSIAPQSLDVWHLSQNFENLPKLNDEFIVDNPPIKRVLAVQDEPEFRIDAYFEYYCYRPMPVYSVPGLIDHF